MHFQANNDQGFRDVVIEHLYISQLTIKEMQGKENVCFELGLKRLGYLDARIPKKTLLHISFGNGVYCSNPAE